MDLRLNIHPSRMPQIGASGIRLTAACLVFLGLLFSGCSIKPQATGQDNELGILVDPVIRESTEAALLSTFCPIVETPQPERRFEPIFGGMEKLDVLQTQKFLLLVGVLDGEGETSALIKKMLSPEVEQGVREGQYFVFVKRNEWAKGQITMILVTPDLISLRDRLDSERDQLLSIFDRQRTEDIKRELFSRYEQVDLAASLRERYGSNLRIPHDWVVVREESTPAGDWVRLKRVVPIRFITLWRSSILDEDPVDSAWVMTVWSEMGLMYEDPIRSNPDFTRMSGFEIGGNKGIEVRGMWETLGPQGGGPFICRAFYDPTDQRAYLLEGEVFNPGEEKEPFLKQIEVILGTFKPTREQSQY